MSRPLVPERLVDVPSQRLYYLSLGCLLQVGAPHPPLRPLTSLQAVKVLDIVQGLRDPNAYVYGRKWFCIDFAYVALLSQLRIPRLTYSKAVVALQILSLWFLDGLLFGAISLHLGANAPTSAGYQGMQSSFPAPYGALTCSAERPDLPATPEPFRIADIFFPFSFFSDAPRGDQHLLGQHTVRMSPISTAHLNPDALTFCLSPPSHSVLIPVLVNNTTPANVRYSFTPLTYIEGQSGTGRIEHIELGGKDLKAIEQDRLEGLQSVRVHSPDDEYEEDEDDTPSTYDSQLQKTQSLTHIRITKPGTIRLERILDSSSVAARLAHPLEVTVVPCPTAYYTDDSIAQPANEVRCQGDTSGIDLTIDIRGVPPLSLRWSKYVDGKKESFLVEGIEDSDTAPRSPPDSRNVRTSSKAPQLLKVPLSLSVESLGRVTFVLESVIDGMGNIVPLDHGVTSETLLREVALNSRTVRSLNILRRPSISFRNCGPGNPVSLFIGSDAPLSLQVTDSDPLDAPWDVDVKFDPSEDRKNSGKSVKPWKDTLQTQQSSLSLSASASGEYTVLGIKGRV